MATKQSNTAKQKTLDVKKKPVRTAGRKARLDAPGAMPEERINDKDAPYPPMAVWMKAAARSQGAKQQITLRLDVEVLEFFRRTGPGYQSRINAVLRSYAEDHQTEE